MNVKNQRLKNNKGQSTIEFLFSFILMVGIFTIFLRVGINSGLGYLTHYATFMASRVFLVYDTNSNVPSGSDIRAAIEGKTEFEKFMKVKGKLDFNKPMSLKSPSHALYVGAIYESKTKLSMFGMLGGKVILNLRSESFLGKEPTRADCLSRVCAALAITLGIQVCDSSEYQDHVTAFDNGC